MNVEKEQALFNKYPSLFGQKDKSMQETCMCWGICVGDGWYDLLDTLCNELKVFPGLQFTQVKEKFGTLRAYTNFTNDKVEEAVLEAERASAKTCEGCGKPAKLNKGPWLRVECKACKKSREAKL